MPIFLRHGRGQFNEKHPIGPAKWPHFDLLFVHRGKVYLEFPKLEKAVELLAPRGALLWPHTDFQGKALTKVAHASIQHFSLEAHPGSPFHLLSGLKNGFTLQSGPLSRDLQRDVDRALALARNPNSSMNEIMRTASLALVLASGGYLEQFDDAPKCARLPLDQLDQWLSANLRSNPGISELANLAGLSISRYRTIFLEENGQTAGEYLRAFRENEARRLLSETREPQKSIATALGYADSVAFSRAFKSRTGLPPGEYRSRHAVTG